MSQKIYPWYKFDPSQWETGDITICSPTAQALFIRICNTYWTKKGLLSYATALKRHKDKYPSGLEELVAEGIIKLDNDEISIDFLDNQLEEHQIFSDKQRGHALKRWKKGDSDANPMGTHSQPNADPLPTLSQPNAMRGEEKRGDKTRGEENEINTPSSSEKDLFKKGFEKFLDLAFKYLGKNYTRGNPNTHRLEATIRQWLLENDPKDAVANLNAYQSTQDKKYQVKSLDGLLKRLSEYNYTQDIGIEKDSKDGFPKYYDPRYEKNLQGNEIMKYHQHLIKLGYKKHSGGAGGTVWEEPKK